ncbi:MAG: hypothetical protein HYY78_07250 [Betaproteobacteria bacterium]|nr:hypothetical protein [Betaproteobacteria bacterium]
MAVIATALQPGELESLRQLTRGAAKKRIPVDHVEKLVGFGFARIRAGTPIITTRGHAKLAFEITRSSWFATPV